MNVLHEDAHRTASHIANLFHQGLLKDDLGAAIAKALIEEREQCAGIALNMPEHTPKAPGLMRATKPSDISAAILAPRK